MLTKRAQSLQEDKKMFRERKLKKQDRDSLMFLEKLYDQINKPIAASSSVGTLPGS